MFSDHFIKFHDIKSNEEGGMYFEDYYGDPVYFKGRYIYYCSNKIHTDCINDLKNYPITVIKEYGEEYGYSKETLRDIFEGWNKEGRHRYEEDRKKDKDTT